jgi:hypothetical protein
VTACGDLQTVNFSNFGVFTYEQGPGLGFCPLPDATYRAEVTRGGPGLYRYEASILEPAEGTVDSCIVTVENECLEEASLPTRVLSEGEVDRLLDAFAAVEVDPEEDPECANVAIDPCRILRYGWDTFQATDFPCSAPRLRSGEAQRIRLLIEELTAASRTAP